jgi:hypothetical protein
MKYFIKPHGPRLYNLFPYFNTLRSLSVAWDHSFLRFWCQLPQCSGRERGIIIRGFATPHRKPPLMVSISLPRANQDPVWRDVTHRRPLSQLWLEIVKRAFWPTLTDQKEALTDVTVESEDGKDLVTLEKKFSLGATIPYPLSRNSVQTIMVTLCKTALVSKDS